MTCAGGSVPARDWAPMRVVALEPAVEVREEEELELVEMWLEVELGQVFAVEVARMYVLMEGEHMSVVDVPGTDSIVSVVDAGMLADSAEAVESRFPVGLGQNACGVRHGEDELL
mmetsp:Transcript_18034/g.27948  ORF Transcript_18034/g.27948 Transcript_18034/m.27948 type:complete len:115 (-) Transcript_18034:1880-2224(-)